MKAILKPALCMNYFYVERMLEDGKEPVPLSSECFRIYAWFQNIKFIRVFGVYLPSGLSYLRINESFQEASSQYSKDSQFFAIAIENMITSYEVSENPNNDPGTFPILLTNLENSHQNVHKLLLELFSKMITYYDDNSQHDRKMLDDVIALSWSNRNKYQLLAVLVSTNCNLLLCHPSFNHENFMGGIQVGLTIHHLLAPSQFLIKSIKGHDVFKPKLMEIVAKLLWDGDDQTAENIIKYWFSTFDQKLVKTLYNVMCEDSKFSENIRTTSTKFHRILLLRNAFKRIFNYPDLETRVMHFACEIEGIPMKIEIFHILMDMVHAETDHEQRLRNILTVLKFLRFNMCIEESMFIDQYVVRKLPDFFNLLASMKLRNVQVLKKIFRIISTDIYQYGIDLGTYESQSFTLKVLNIVLKQYYGKTGSRLSKNTNIEGNLSFGKYLKDNQIWDVTSIEVFLTLINLLDSDEHSDISELAENMIIEHFITNKQVEEFTIEEKTFDNWIDLKVDEELLNPKISSASSTNRYSTIMFESMWYSSVADEYHLKLIKLIGLLESRFEMLTALNPVHYMQGRFHLYKMLDCINYGIKKCNSITSDQIKILLKDITKHFLDYITDPDIPPSFEILDEKLTGLIKRSNCQYENFDDLKHQLTLFIWYTLRSLSEISETLAKVSNSTYDDKLNFEMLETCININIEILTRCCHKGAIDSASKAIGTITKIISNEYSKYCFNTKEPAFSLHKLLVILKSEIDCGKRPSSKTGDIRSSRGLIVMSHKIITNHPPFLRFPMEVWLVTSLNANMVKFNDKIMPIQLHLLAALIKDGDLAEEMLKYYNHILLATFKAYKESTDFVVINALLQIIGAIVPKIANQKRHIMMGSETAMPYYEPKSVSAFEFHGKFPHVFEIALEDLANTNLPVTYTIILLEIFSNFEHRNATQPFPEIKKILKVFKRLMSHHCEKIRFLAAKCHAQWVEVNDEMLALNTKEVLEVFSSNGNIVHSAIHCSRFMIQRYESNVKFVRSFNPAAFLSSLRKAILKSYKKNQRGFRGAHNFYLRYHLLDFLMFLGFPFDSDIVQGLMIESGLKSHIGYKMFAQKIKDLSKM